MSVCVTGCGSIFEVPVEYSLTSYCVGAPYPSLVGLGVLGVCWGCDLPSVVWLVTGMCYDLEFVISV